MSGNKCLCTANLGWQFDMDAMAVDVAADLQITMDAASVCQVGRTDIVARLLIEHTRLIEGVTLSDVFERAQEISAEKRQGAH